MTKAAEAPSALQLTDAELHTVRDLITDWGWEYALKADRQKVIVLAKKLGLEQFAKGLEV